MIPTGGESFKQYFVAEILKYKKSAEVREKQQKRHMVDTIDELIRMTSVREEYRNLISEIFACFKFTDTPPFVVSSGNMFAYLIHHPENEESLEQVMEIIDYYTSRIPKRQRPNPRPGFQGPGFMDPRNGYYGGQLPVGGTPGGVMVYAQKN